ncbi:MAG: hypothetical protein M1819_002360 [Sarea resinae]|nr:MAG: hypothetical protein M1819_002360 [Sarea resinae]
MQGRSDTSDHDDNNAGATQDATAAQTPTRVDPTPPPDDSDGNPPAKKRKLADPAVRQRSSSRPISPPWKKIAVEGPTSFVEGGRRKSSRTNAIPLDLQPQSGKRQTRAAAQKTSIAKSGTPSLRNSTTSKSAATQTQSNGKRPQSAGRPTSHIAGKSPAKSGALKNTSSKTPTLRSSKSQARLSQHASSSPKVSAKPTRRSTRTTSAAVVKEPEVVETNGWHSEDEGSVEVDANFKPQKLKFRVRMPTVPIQHPDHIVPPRRFSSFQEWVESDDPLSGEDVARLSKEDARKEAILRQRILEAGLSGGILSEDKCSLYVPEPQEEPPRQYAHQDHLVAQAIHFQKLLKQESRHHRLTAKKLAHAAAAEWRRRQPKTEEEIIQEQREATLARFKQVRKDLQQKWDMVTGEVNKRRLARWEEQQQLLGKQALNQMLEQSTQLLDKRRMRLSSEMSNDDQDGDDNTDDDDAASDETDGEETSGDDDESNMSTSESENEDEGEVRGVDDDEGLTVEELRRKYSGIPEDMPSTDGVGLSKDMETPDTLGSAIAEDQEPSREDTADVEYDMADVEIDEVDEKLLDDSDESTDMDSDMGDSEGSSEEDDEEGSDEEDAAPGLLGFFSRKEVQEVTNESEKEDLADESGFDQEANVDEEAEEIEELSLVPDTPLIETPEVETPRVESQAESPQDEPLQAENPTLTPISRNADEPIVKPRQSPTPPVVNGEHLSPDVMDTSQAHSSQASPRTNATTKTPEADSISSVDPPIGGRRSSSLTTPQPSYTPKTPIPSLLRGTLREYQRFGLDWLAGLYANGTNGILADEMGLGKTIQTIALLAHLAVEHHVWGPHLIVVPTSVMLNWEMEFKKWCPGFKILTYYGSQEERKAKRKGWMDDDLYNVCITSYQLILQDAVTFKRRGWHYMILDEAHNIKNFRSQRWQTLLTFRTRARLLLTGTPLQNNLTELWSLLFFLMPSDHTENGIGGFADLKEFSDWFRKPVEQIMEHGRETMDDEAKGIVSKLHKVLRPYLLRRLKADVEKQMPLKYEHVVYCRLSKRQRYLYDGFMSLSQTRETLATGNYFSIINCLMQLRKVCNHPDLFETRQIVTSFAMPKSVVADYEIKELLVRRRLLREDPMTLINFDFLNLTPTMNEKSSSILAYESSRLIAYRQLQDLCRRQGDRIDWRKKFNASSVSATLESMENAARMSRLEELRHCVYLNAIRSQRVPIYGKGLIDLLTLDQRPVARQPQRTTELSKWYLNTSSILQSMIPTLDQRSEDLQTTVQKFACITPVAVATDMAPLTLSPRGVEAVQRAQEVCTTDAFHEARVRLSIAFPDKRLLQYDCGKLQRLDTLLRDLQAGGHRALIFTQMTKVLDILEQFLNIHGHRYLRLDGATKVEQRQILTERFNNDPRILAFILSSRSGGLGINLTGADTVIFYDLDWNPAMDKQCQDRCHRIGQTRDVHIYRFVSEYTIESNILRKANQKRMLDDVVIQEGEFTTDYFNKLSLRDIVGDDVAATVPDMDGHDEAIAAMDRVLGNAGAGRVLEEVEDIEDRNAAKLAEREILHADDADFDEKAAAAAVAAAGATTGEGGSSSSAVGTPKTVTGTGPPTPTDLGTAKRERERRRSTAVETSTTLEAAESGLASTKPTAHHDHDHPHDDPMDLDDNDNVIDNAEDGDDDADAEPGHVDEYMLRFVEWELKDVPVAAPVDRGRKKSKKGHQGIGRARKR